MFWTKAEMHSDVQYSKNIHHVELGLDTVGTRNSSGEAQMTTWYNNRWRRYQNSNNSRHIWRSLE